MSTLPKYIPKALLRPRGKPFLIWAAPPFLALYGLTYGAFATLVAFTTQSGFISIRDQPVSDFWYLAGIYPIALLGALVSVAAAYGLMAERLWARQLLTKGAAALLVLDLAIGQLVANVPFRVLILERGMAWLLLGLSFWFSTVTGRSGRTTVVWKRLSSSIVAATVSWELEEFEGAVPSNHQERPGKARS